MTTIKLSGIDFTIDGKGDAYRTVEVPYGKFIAKCNDFFIRLVSGGETLKSEMTEIKIQPFDQWLPHHTIAKAARWLLAKGKELGGVETLLWYGQGKSGKFAGSWFICLPKQKNSGGTVEGEDPELVAWMTANGIDMKGTIHTHPGVGNYASHTDSKSWRTDFPGIHYIIAANGDDIKIAAYFSILNSEEIYRYGEELTRPYKGEALSLTDINRRHKMTDIFTVARHSFGFSGGSSWTPSRQSDNRAKSVRTFIPIWKSSTLPRDKEFVFVSNKWWCRNATSYGPFSECEYPKGTVLEVCFEMSPASITLLDTNLSNKQRKRLTKQGFGIKDGQTGQITSQHGSYTMSEGGLALPADSFPLQKSDRTPTQPDRRQLDLGLMDDLESVKEKVMEDYATGSHTEDLTILRMTGLARQGNVYAGGWLDGYDVGAQDAVLSFASRGA